MRSLKNLFGKRKEKTPLLLKIYHGAPQTGKTRQAMQQLEQYDENERLIINGSFISTSLRAGFDINRQIHHSQKKIKALLIDDVRDGFNMLSLTGISIELELLIVTYRGSCKNQNMLHEFFKNIEFVDFNKEGAPANQQKLV
jgi:hypothetical protein